MRRQVLPITCQESTLPDPSHHSDSGYWHSLHIRNTPAETIHEGNRKASHIWADNKCSQTLTHYMQQWVSRGPSSPAPWENTGTAGTLPYIHPVLLQDAPFPAHSRFKKKIKGDLHYHYKLVPAQQHRTDDTLTVMSHEAKFPSRERHCLHYSTPWKRVNHYEETLCQTLADSLLRDYIFPYMINPG